MISYKSDYKHTKIISAKWLQRNSSIPEVQPLYDMRVVETSLASVTKNIKLYTCIRGFGQCNLTLKV